MKEAPVSLAILIPFIAVLANFIFYKINEKYFSRIILLYLSVMLLFSNFYFLLMLFFDNGTIPFKGIHPIWQWLDGLQGRTIYLNNAFKSFIDCVHYSCVTITTLGHGDMLPVRWYTKLLTDFEVILGVGILIISFGRYFSESNKKKYGGARKG